MLFNNIHRFFIFAVSIFVAKSIILSTMTRKMGIYLRILLLVLTFFVSKQLFAQHAKAPMYYSLYAYLYTLNNNSTTQYAMPETMWKDHIDYLATHLAPLGFDMIVTDGWGEPIRNSNGFRIKHHSNWNNDFAYWGQYAQNKGVKLGLYENPLWLDDKNAAMYSNYPALWFKWIDINHANAEDFIKRYIEFYASFGVKYLRVDFMSWYEDGRDKNPDFEVRHNRPMRDYVKTLQVLKKYCDANNMQLSLVMPHLKIDGINERLHAPGSMIRVNEDQCEGKWHRLSEIARGKKHIDNRTNEIMWSLFHNTFDGMIYWSQFSGFDTQQNELILDGDFIWLSSFANDEEKKSALTINLVAGGAIALTEYTISDIQQSIHLLQNQEVFALNAAGFVGKPLSHDPVNQSTENQAKTQVWRGKMPGTDDYIVAFFNRESTSQNRTIAFSDLPDNLHANYQVRDLWAKQDLGQYSNQLVMNVGARSCKLFRLTPLACTKQPQEIMLPSIADVQLPQGSTTIQLPEVSSASLPLHYTVKGDATIASNVLQLGKYNGRISITAKQVGNGSYCPAIATTSFDVKGGCNPHYFMYVAGNFSTTSSNNWLPAKNPMIKQGDTWIAVINIESTGQKDLVFTSSTTWDKKWGGATGLSGTCIETTTATDGNDVKFTATATGLYLVRFNECDLSYVIQKVNASQSAMYIGSNNINGWTLTDTPMLLSAANTWQVTLPLSVGDYQLKFANTNNWTGQDWGDATGLQGTAKNSTGGKPNINFSIIESGMYRIAFNDQTLAYSIVKQVPTHIGSSFVKDTYPVDVMYNPLEKILYIQLDIEQTATLLFYSLSGKQVHKQELNTVSSVVYLPESKEEVLILVLIAKEGVQTYKIHVPK
jgi:hypothetical protein